VGGLAARAGGETDDEDDDAPSCIRACLRARSDVHQCGQGVVTAHHFASERMHHSNRAWWLIRLPLLVPCMRSQHHIEGTMRSNRFCTRLLSIALLAACRGDADRASAKPGAKAVLNDSFVVDSMTKRVRYSVRPARPPFVASAALLIPNTVALESPAPDSFHIEFETSQGTINVAVVRAWAPLGVDRLHYLARHGFFTGMKFYKVQRDFIAQFGYTGNPQVSAVWDTMQIADEPSVQPHAPGTLAFASKGPNTRSTLLFFNMRNNQGLEASGLAVVGRVVKGLEVLPRIYDVYGQGLGDERIIREGDRYLEEFVDMDYILRATVKP